MFTTTAIVAATITRRHLKSETNNVKLVSD